MRQKTLFISLFHFLASRNLLTGEVFETLCAHPDLRLVLFVPHYKKDFFLQHYKKDNVVIEGIDEAVVATWPFKFFKWLSFCLTPTYTIKLRLRERLYQNKSWRSYFKYAISRLTTILLARSKTIHRLVRKLDTIFSPNQFLNSYIDRYQPHALFVTDMFSEIEPLFIQGAKKRGVMTIGMVRSWDNTTTKGLMRALPDWLIVNNEIIKEEASTFHDVKEEDIFVGGIPQYDLSFRDYHSSRKDFFERINVDPQKRLILLAPAGSLLSDTDWQFCEILKKAFSEKKLPDDLHFLIRNHPGCLPKLEKFEADSHFTIEWPGTGFKNINYKNRELSPDDARHLIDSLYHSQLVISVNSTITIDALPFDKPQIMVEFDGWERRPYLNSVRRYHDEDHMRKYIIIGAARITRSPEELISWLNQYLNNPKLDSEKRKSALEEQIYFSDGHSGKRIANFILKTF